MSISVQCTQCGGSFQVADKFAGSKIRCPKCKVGVIQIAAAESDWDDGGFRLKPDETIYQAADESLKRRGSFLKSRTVRLWMHRGRNWLGTAIVLGGLIAAGYFVWSEFGGVDVAGPEMAQEAGMVPSGSPVEDVPAPFSPISGSDEFVANSPESSTMTQGTEQPASSTSTFVPAGQDSSNGAIQANVRSSADAFSPMTLSPQTAGNSSSVASETADFWRGGRRMRSTLYPIEVEFPSSQVIGLTSRYKKGAIVYLQRPERGVIQRETIIDESLRYGGPTLFGVTCTPRLPGETDQEAIKRVAFVDATTPSGSGGAVHTPTRHEGFLAVDTQLAPKNGQNLIHLRSRVIAHPTGIYEVSAQAKGLNSAALERFIASFHFLDQPGTAAEGVMRMPLAAGEPWSWPGYDITGQPNSEGKYILWEAIPLQ